jgi:hypothetical protein
MPRVRTGWVLACLFLLFGSASPAQEHLIRPEVDDDHQKFFYYFNDSRSVPVSVLHELALDSEKVGRSFALIAGISEYPHLPDDKELSPAAEDIRKLAEYLQKVEFFDEIIVLRNEDVTSDNLEYFLQGYLPDRLKSYPNSRLLVAYSGHGFTFGTSSFALSSLATNLKDRFHSLNLFNLRNFIEIDRPLAQHTLALLNTCNSGAFLDRPYGENKFDLYGTGAHAITAGTVDQLVWSYPKVGTGSLLFEKLFAALDGRANKTNKEGQNTGLVTVGELFRYLSDQIAETTKKKQTPKWGDLDPDGSKGSFYFFDRDRLVKANLVAPWESNPPLLALNQALLSLNQALILEVTQIHPASAPVAADLGPPLAYSTTTPDQADVPWPSGAVEGGTYVVQPQEREKVISYLKLPRNFTLSLDPSIEEIHWTVTKMEFGSGATIDLSSPRTIPAPGPSGQDVPGQPGVGMPGMQGGRGSAGINGRNGRTMTLRVTELTPHGSLWIRTDGGLGGSGGRGGNGQLGGPSSCGLIAGGRVDGGPGGSGGDGGEGGRGGSTSTVDISIDKIPGRSTTGWVATVTDSTLKCGPSERPEGLMEDDGRIVIYGHPGCAGIGGTGGAPGPGGDEGHGKKCGLIGIPVGGASGGTPGTPGGPGRAGAYAAAPSSRPQS